MRLRSTFALAGAAFALIPVPAQAAPPEGGEVMYAVAYKNRCDGGVDVGLANATTRETVFRLNGQTVPVAPSTTILRTVADPDGADGVALVVRVEVDSPGVVNSAQHTWTVPASGCVQALAVPSAPAPSVMPQGGAVPAAPASPRAREQAAPQLVSTGSPVWMLLWAAVGLIGVGLAALRWGRRQVRFVA